MIGGPECLTGDRGDPRLRQEIGRQRRRRTDWLASGLSPQQLTDMGKGIKSAARLHAVDARNLVQPFHDEPPPRVLDRAIEADAVGHLCGERRYVSEAGGMHAGEAGWRSWHRAS